MMIDCLETKEHTAAASGGGGGFGQQHHQHQRQPPAQFVDQTYRLGQQQQQPTLIEVDGVNNTTTTTAMASNDQQQANNELIGYYFGSISRDTAEWILKSHGNQANGAYLLRSSGPNDDFVLSLMVNHGQNHQQPQQTNNNMLEVLHYKIVETEDSFVALHGQVGDEKFATIDELIDKAQGVATKPRWPIHRQFLESQILPPTYWGLTVDQIRLAILIKAKQWGFPLLSSLFQQQQQQQQPQSQTSEELQSCGSPTAGDSATAAVAAAAAAAAASTTPSSATTLNNETIRTLIYKSLHEFQPWFHGKIGRDEAERRIEEGHLRDGRFLVRERDNYSYAMCISHKKTTKHYRIDVLPTGELAIQDGRKFTSLMALVSHYTIMSDGLWCALTEACPRPIQGQQQVAGARQMTTANNGQGVVAAAATMVQQQQQQQQSAYSTAINTLSRSYPHQNGHHQHQQGSMYCTAPPSGPINNLHNMMLLPPPPPPLPLPQLSGNENVMPTMTDGQRAKGSSGDGHLTDGNRDNNGNSNNKSSLICAQQGSVASLRGPIKEWLQTINHKWSQLMAAKNQHQSLNSFLFGNQNPLNNHCRHHHHMSHPHHHGAHHNPGHHHRRKCKNGHVACACVHQHHHQQQQQQQQQQLQHHHQQQQMLMVMANGKHQPNDVTLARQPFMNLGNQLAGGLTTSGATSGRLSDFSSATNNNHGGGGGGGNYLGTGEVHGGACCLQQAAICPTETIYRDNLMPKNHQLHLAQGAAGGAAAAPSFDSAQLTASSSLLSCLPQNSGFALNSQSFIGSPLFAVRSAPTTTTTQQQQQQQLGEPRAASHHRSGSSNSGSGSGNNNLAEGGEEEVKLISPVQSISARLNKHHTTTNPYNLSQDIYGSQTSTALVSNSNHHHLHRLPTSSSSSSGGQTWQQQPPPPPQQQQLNSNRLINVNYPQPQKGLVAVGGGGGHPPLKQQPYYKPSPLAAAAAAVIPSTQAAGPILCGQHAGPAYRYTNCGGLGDDNTFRPCLHNQRHGPHLPAMNRMGLRAADDSHLITSSTQLAGPAAMAKFVQFQDGQCLRTHRDTRSIQQAYLSSRQQHHHKLVANSNSNNNGNNNNNLAWNNNQVPPKEFANAAAAALQHNQFIHLAAKNNAHPLQPGPMTGGYCAGGASGGGGGTTATLLAGHNNAQQQFGKQFNHQHPPHHHQQQQQQHQQQPLPSVATTTAPVMVNDEIDLMDCGDGGAGFDFKYDPKLIKSSSIETLCGVGGGDGDGADEEDDDDDLDDINFDAFKTNSELIMSLQSCWFANTNGNGNQQQHQAAVSSLLSPIPASLFNQQEQQSVAGEQQLNSSSSSSNGIDISASNHHQADGSILSTLMEVAGTAGHQEDHMKKKHDLDELTTALLAELTASLKAQVDLKNKRSGFGGASSSGQALSAHLHHFDKSSATAAAGAEQNNQQQQQSKEQPQHEERVNSEVNPLELINEFDTLLANNNR